MVDAEFADDLENALLVAGYEPKPTGSRTWLQRAEQLWSELQGDNLGGYSGINRPFWIAHQLRLVYAEACAIEREVVIKEWQRELNHYLNRGYSNEALADQIGRKLAAS